MSTRRYRAQRAFTLIELLVVILILGILMAIALPTFLGQQSKAQDAALQTELNSVYKAEKAAAISHSPSGSLATGNPLLSEVTSSEPELSGLLSVTDTPATGHLGICSNSGSGLLHVAGMSNSGTEYVLNDNSQGQFSITPGACATGIISTIAGDSVRAYSGDGGSATSAGLGLPSYVALDSSNNLYITDEDSNVIRMVPVVSGTYWGQPMTAGDIYTVAGDGTGGFSGDGGVATSAELSNPAAVAFDPQGNMYIADAYNDVVRKINRSTGIITTAAGNNTLGAGYSGDGGPATAAQLFHPLGLAFDSAGNLYISEWYNNDVREVNHSTGIITTVAGDEALGGPMGGCPTNHCTGGYSGDGGPATSAQLNTPSAIAIDNSGNIYIADENNHRIREVTRTTGIINTVAGDGGTNDTGDGGPATSAEIGGPGGVAVDPSGNIFIPDDWNSVVREVNSATGTISTFAGDTSLCACDSSGDGGPASSADLDDPESVAIDSLGDVYIADTWNFLIRKVTP